MVTRDNFISSEFRRNFINFIMEIPFCAYSLSQFSDEPVTLLSTVDDLNAHLAALISHEIMNYSVLSSRKLLNYIFVIFGDEEDADSGTASYQE